MENFVTKDVCAEVEKRVSEHYNSNAKLIADGDNRQRELEKLNARAMTLLENHQSCIEDHDKRIGTLESKPAKLVSAATTTAITTMVGAIIAAVMYIILK